MYVVITQIVSNFQFFEVKVSVNRFQVRTPRDLMLLNDPFHGALSNSFSVANFSVAAGSSPKVDKGTAAAVAKLRRFFNRR